MEKKDELLNSDWCEIITTLNEDYEVARKNNYINRMGYLARLLEKVQLHIDEL